MQDYVHMRISIPPKYAVSQVVGYIKGKSAIHLARVYGERKRNFVGQHFWARGCVFAGSESSRSLVAASLRQARGWLKGNEFNWLMPIINFVLEE